MAVSSNLKEQIINNIVDVLWNLMLDAESTRSDEGETRVIRESLDKIIKDGCVTPDMIESVRRGEVSLT